MLFSRTRDIIGIAGLILIVLLSIFVFKFIGSGGLDGLRSNFSNDWQDLKTRLTIVRDNTRDLISPPRKSPLSLLVAETRLKQALPQLFGTFEKEDWGYFWNLIYGVHERDDYGVNYTPKRKRQLNIEEIEDILSSDYPQSFGRFNAQFWGEFWKLVFAKR